jgi:Family of unknown function (DUF5684)
MDLLFAQGNGGDAAGGALAMLCGCGFQIVWLAVIIVMIVGMWKVFEKAGQPGWAAIVPIYNGYVLVTQIVGRDILWFILLLIPCVNLVASFVVCRDLAKSFGKDIGYGLGLMFLGFIFFPMLGFGKDRYLGPAGKDAPAF